MNDAAIVPFFATLRDANPEPASELEYASVFELLISVLLSAQTTDKRVNQVTKALFAAGPTPAKMLALGAETIEAMIKPVGFLSHEDQERARDVPHPRRGARRRGAAHARSARGASRRRPQDCERRPQQRLRRSDARGRHPRLSRRQPHRARARRDAARVELGLLQRVPEEFLQNAHHWLILHGRYVCLARRPLCEVCRVARWCDSAPALLAPRAKPEAARATLALRGAVALAPHLVEGIAHGARAVDDARPLAADRVAVQYVEPAPPHRGKVRIRRHAGESRRVDGAAQERGMAALVGGEDRLGVGREHGFERDLRHQRREPGEDVATAAERDHLADDLPVR
jgi:endonuclease-3